MTTLYSSTFDVAGSDVALESFTPEVGSPLVGTGSTVMGSNAGKVDWGTSAFYSIDTGHADGSIQFIISSKNGASNSYVAYFRLQGDNRRYQFYIDINGCRLEYHNGTSPTTLASHSGTSNPDTTARQVTVAWTGTHITVVKDGFTLIDYTGSELSAAGKSALSCVNSYVYNMVIADGTVPAPTINTHPADQTVNEGSPVTFSVTATASAGSLTYQWKRAEAADLGTYAPVSGATSASYTITSTDCVVDSGINVICTVGDSNSSIDSNAASLLVRSVTTTVPPGYDIDTTGWTTSSGVEYFALIDESVASDADYITSPTITSTPAPIDLELKYPLNTGTWNVFVRTKTSSGTATLRVHLLNASNTIVGTSADQAITGTYTTYELPVTISEPASIIRTEVVV